MALKKNRRRKNQSGDEFDILQQIAKDAQKIEDNGYIVMLTDIAYIDLLENNLSVSLINKQTNKTKRLRCDDIGN